MYEYRATLIRVVDGDTAYLDVDLGFGVWRRNQSYRLGRIDAPEMSTVEGPVSKAQLDTILTSASFLMVTTSKADKYGRWLIELYADGYCVNDQLVAGGYAVYRTY